MLISGLKCDIEAKTIELPINCRSGKYHIDKNSSKKNKNSSLFEILNFELRLKLYGVVLMIS